MSRDQMPAPGKTKLTKFPPSRAGKDVKCPGFAGGGGMLKLRFDWYISSMKSHSRMLVASKAAFLENYLAVSSWILNESSIECHEKKHQPFSLSGVRFGSRAIQISGSKSVCRWSGRKWALRLWLLLKTCNESARNPPNRSNTPFWSAKVL